MYDLRDEGYEINYWRISEKIDNIRNEKDILVANKIWRNFISKKKISIQSLAKKIL